MKRLLKWSLRIAVLGLAVVALLLFFRNDILRVVAERQIQAQTGLDVKIGRFSSGLFSPVVTAENVRIYNPPEFGGSEFLVVPDLHIEIDAEALAHEKLRFKLLRVNIAELSIVKNLAGETNLVVMFAKMPRGKTSIPGLHVSGKKFKFEDIDMLNLSVGTLHFVDLKHPEKNRDVRIDVENQPFPNVQGQADLGVIAGVLWLHGGGAAGIPPGELLDLVQACMHAKTAGAGDRTEQPAPAGN